MEINTNRIKPLYPQQDPEEATPHAGMWRRLVGRLGLSAYLLKRLLLKPKRRFWNLEETQNLPDATDPQDAHALSA